MKRQILLIFLIPLLGFTQGSFETQIDSVTSSEDAELFLKSHKSGQVYVFNKEKHKTRLAQELFQLSKGSKKVVQTNLKKTYYKIIDKNKTLHHRVHYILLDGASMPMNDVNQIRKDIILKYRKGYDFKTLAKYYSMDINAKKGGDSGWFTEGDMPNEFQKAVEVHAPNDIFSLDLHEDKAHYIILKSHDSKVIDEITVLKFSETTR